MFFYDRGCEVHPGNRFGTRREYVPVGSRHASMRADGPETIPGIPLRSRRSDRC